MSKQAKVYKITIKATLGSSKKMTTGIGISHSAEELITETLKILKEDPKLKNYDIKVTGCTYITSNFIIDALPRN